MGFIHTEDFQKEIELGLSIDTRIAGVLANELKDKIFYSVDSDISDVYEPINLSLEKEVGIKEKSEISISDFSSSAEESIPIITQKSESPFILQEEKSVAPVENKKSILKSIGIPLGFFKKKDDIQAPPKPTRVEVEVPVKDEKRTVNYSELRTSISPFENPNFLNIPVTPKVQKTEDNIPKVETNEPGLTEPEKSGPAPAPEIPKKPSILKMDGESNPAPLIINQNEAAPGDIKILGTIKKSQPRVEGNVIDLKN